MPGQIIIPSYADFGASSVRDGLVYVAEYCRWADVLYPELWQGTVGAWKLDAAGVKDVDYSGHGNDGARKNGLTRTLSSYRGRTFGSLYTDGTDQHVNCGGKSSVKPNSFTVSSYVKWTDTGDTTEGHLFGWTGGGTQPAFYIDFVGKPLLYMGSSNYRYFVAAAKSTLADGDWHHVIVSIPGNAQSDIDNAEMWVDGVQQSVDSTYSVAGQAAKGNFTLADIDGGGANSFTGQLSNICLHNRDLPSAQKTILSKRPLIAYECRLRPRVFVVGGAAPSNWSPWLLNQSRKQFQPHLSM